MMSMSGLPSNRSRRSEVKPRSRTLPYRRGISLPPAERMHIDGKRIDGCRIEPIGPRRHHTGAAIGDRFDDGGLVRTVEPDPIRQVWSAQILIAPGVVTMATGAAF